MLLLQLPHTQPVTYFEYEPSDPVQFPGTVAEEFHRPVRQTELVLAALKYLDELGAIYLKKKQIAPKRTGSHGAVYPAQIQVTVYLH